MSESQVIYSKTAIDFATVAAEMCLFLEHTSEKDKQDFISKATKLLPLLYLQATLIEEIREDIDAYLEPFVKEDDYLFVKHQIESLLGADDNYLEVFDPNMPYSDTPIAAFISENLADIYQELKDFAANFQVGEVDIMTAALFACADSFAEHWGQKAVNALRALHDIRYNDNTNEEKSEFSTSDEYRKLTKEQIFKFQSDEEEE